MAKSRAPIDLDKTRAFKKLQTLAQNPIDLTDPAIDWPARIAALQAEACGYRLLYATQQVTPKVLAALQALADESGVVRQFGQMMRGAKMNHVKGKGNENRRVLHTASRNIFPRLACRCDAGQADAVAAAKKQLRSLKTFLGKVASGAIANAKGQTFTDIVQVGIGGSDLGPRALYLALPEHRLKGRRVHFLSNVDPDDAAQVLKGLNLARTLVAVVSKSGTTLETCTNEALVADYFAAKNLDKRRHFVAVTGKDSEMDRPDDYLAVFNMYDYIGGRFSATSMVGGVALAFGLGLDTFKAILRGARKMDLNALETDATRNLALLAALLGVWNRNALGHETVAILPYSQALVRFVAHLQQLDMESNGKSVNRQGKAVPYPTGPIVWGEPGTNGQHAFYQLIHQSQTTIPSEFIGYRRSQAGQDIDHEGTTSQQKFLANLLAQSIGLATGKPDADNLNKNFPGNRPNSILMGEQLTPEALGALLAYYENKIAFQGFLWNINSFDQEGVQLGKKLANGIIDVFKGKSTEDDVSNALLEAAGLGRG